MTLRTTLRAAAVCALAFVPLTRAADTAPPAKSDAPAAQPGAPAAAHNTLTDSERQAGWVLLFDGQTPTAFRGLGMDGFPEGRWVVEDGCLRCLGNAKAKDNAKANDLVTKDEYENFELTWEWTTPKPNGNTGLKYRVQEEKGKGYAFGPEYQCMADGAKADKGSTGSLYDVLPPAATKKTKPAGEFNQSRVVVQGNRVEHWLNGEKTVEFEFGSEALNAAVAQSKFKGSKTWAANPRGRIALQDHNDEALFRNLKIRPLPTSGAAAAGQK